MLINIAICDDEKAQIDNLKKFVSQWANEYNFNVNISEFKSAEHFLFYYEDNKNFNILLLDIEMGKLNGIDLAKKIRTENEAVQIIFITGFPDFISEGYEVSALHYLMKPVGREKLCDVLNKAVAKLKKEEKSLVINNTKINLSEILYIEAFAHSCEFTLLSGDKIKSSQKISALESELKSAFIRCHRSYIVGIRHIKHIDKTEILLDNGGAVPLSRRLYTDVNKAFIAYFREIC